MAKNVYVRTPPKSVARLSSVWSLHCRIKPTSAPRPALATMAVSRGDMRKS